MTKIIQWHHSSPIEKKKPHKFPMEISWGNRLSGLSMHWKTPWPVTALPDILSGRQVHWISDSLPTQHWLMAFCVPWDKNRAIPCSSPGHLWYVLEYLWLVTIKIIPNLMGEAFSCTAFFIGDFSSIHPNHQINNTKKSKNTLVCCFPCLCLYKACLQPAGHDKKVIYSMCCGTARLNFRSQQLR